MNAELRPATPDDSSSLIELIDGVYREYGDQIFLEGFDRDLLDLEANYSARGGAFVVLENEGRLVGSHAALPLDPADGLATFRRLYLHRDFRGGGAGALLMDWAIEWARERGFRRVEFWSDTRFERAHRFFQRYGFKKGEIREMTDGWMPYSEFHFRLDL